MVQEVHAWPRRGAFQRCSSADFLMTTAMLRRLVLAAPKLAPAQVVIMPIYRIDDERSDVECLLRGRPMGTRAYTAIIWRRADSCSYGQPRLCAAVIPMAVGQAGLRFALKSVRACGGR